MRACPWPSLLPPRVRGRTPRFRFLFLLAETLSVRPTASPLSTSCSTSTVVMAVEASTPTTEDNFPLPPRVPMGGAVNDGPRRIGGGTPSTVAGAAASAAEPAATATTATEYFAPSPSLSGWSLAEATADHAPSDGTAVRTTPAAPGATDQDAAQRRVASVYRRLESLDSSEMLVIVAGSIPDSENGALAAALGRADGDMGSKVGRDSCEDDSGSIEAAPTCLPESTTSEAESAEWASTGATHVSAPVRCFSFSSDGAHDEGGDYRSDDAYRGGCHNASQFGSPISTETLEHVNVSWSTPAVPTEAAVKAAATAAAKYGSGEDHGGGRCRYTCRPPPSPAVSVPNMARDEDPPDTAAQWALNGDGYVAMDEEESGSVREGSDVGARGSEDCSLSNSLESTYTLLPQLPPTVADDVMRLVVEPKRGGEDPMEDVTSSPTEEAAMAFAGLSTAAASTARPRRSCPRPFAHHQALEERLSALVAACSRAARIGRNEAIARKNLPPAAAAAAAASTARHEAVVVAAATAASKIAVATIAGTLSEPARSNGGNNGGDSGSGAGQGRALIAVAAAVGAAAGEHLQVWRKEVAAAAAAASENSTTAAVAPLPTSVTSAAKGGVVAAGKRSEADTVAGKRHSADVYEAALLAVVPPAAVDAAEEAAEAARQAIIVPLKAAKAKAAAAEAAAVAAATAIATVAGSAESGGVGAAAAGASARSARVGRAGADDRTASWMARADKNRLFNNRISAAGTRAARAARVASLKEYLLSGVWPGAP